MKRLEVEGEKVETRLMDLPMELQALILLHRFHFQIKSVRKWHELQKIFRSVPQFGKTRVATIFYQGIKLFSEELFEIFYTLREYPPFPGVTSLKPTVFLEYPHMAMVESMKKLSSLDLGEFNGKFPIHSLVNLTSLRGYSNLEDADLENLTNLTKLDLSDCTKITDDGLKKLTNLTEIDFGEMLLGGKLSCDVFIPLTKLDEVAFSLMFLNRRLDNIPFALDSLVTGLKNITTLQYTGHLLMIKSLLENLPNLSDLAITHFYLDRNDTSQYFSKITALTRLAFVNGAYCFSVDEIEALQSLKTFSITNTYNRQNDFKLPNFEEFTNLNELSIRFNDSHFFMNTCPQENIKKLTGLSTLSLRCKISDFGLCLPDLPILTHLDVASNPMVQDRDLRDLTNLKRLDISACTKLTRNAINRMTSLERLGVLAQDYKTLKKKVNSLDIPGLRIIKIL